MPHVHQSKVKAWAQKAPLHSRPVRPRTPPSAPPENDPHHHAVVAAQYHPAARLLNMRLLLLNMRLLMMILILMLLIRIKLILMRLRLLKMIRLIMHLLIHLIILLVLCRVHRLGWTRLWRWSPTASTLPSLLPPPLPRPAIGGCNACFSLRKLPIGEGFLALNLSLLSWGGLGGLWDVFLRKIFAQHFQQLNNKKTYNQQQQFNL